MKRFIPFDEVERAALGSITRILSRWLPDGKLSSRKEWVSLNPLRPDQNEGSFSVNTATGKWKDFATHEGGTQIIGLVAYLEQVDINTAAWMIADFLSLSFNSQGSVDPWRIHPELGKPVAVWAYQKDGQVVMFSRRFNKPTKEGKSKSGKEHIPLSLIDGKWAAKWLPAPRPLYGVDEVVSDSKQCPVIVNEGEKKVLPSLEIFGPDFLATCSSGGSGQFDKTDWSPLYGRSVYFFRDQDDPGILYMCQVALLLWDHCELFEIVPLRKADRVKGWDAADAVLEGYTRKDFALEPLSRSYVEKQLQDAKDRISKEKRSPSKMETETEVSTVSPSKNAIPSISDEKDIPPKLRQLDLTDFGTAQRMAFLYQDRLSFVDGFGWMVYDGRRYVTESDREEMPNNPCLNERQLFFEMTDGLEQQAHTEGDPDRREILLKWVKRCKSTKGKSGCFDFLKDDARIKKNRAMFDAQPFKLNVNNGTIDLQTSLLTKHNSQDCITKLSTVQYEKHAPCETFQKFLTQIFEGDGELIRWVQKAVGYSMTADTREQCMFVCSGQGRNGKGTLFRVLEVLMGTYAQTTDASVIMQTNRSGDIVMNMIAKLQSARLVLMSESDSENVLSSGLVKRATGEDKMDAKRLYRDTFSFMPIWKIWFATNHLPIITRMDDGIRSRLRVIPFRKYFNPSERDPLLFKKLTFEMSGILNWAMEGARLWLKEGLGTCEAIESATSVYWEAQDRISAFIRERCVVGAHLKCSTTLMYEQYRDFTIKNGEKPFSATRFTTAFEEKDFGGKKLKRIRDGQMMWEGIAILSDRDLDPSPYPSNGTFRHDSVSKKPPQQDEFDHLPPYDAEF